MNLPESTTFLTTIRIGDHMRYEKPENLIRLVLKMQGTAEGVGLMDIQEEFSVSRRTAERMRDAVRYLYPQVDEIIDDDRIKRWRLPPGTANNLVAFSAEELANLETAISLLERENMSEAADTLRGVTTKINSLLHHSTLWNIGPDLEVLMQAEGFAIRPGPRPAIDREIFERLRTAIKNDKKVQIHYHSRTYGALSRQRVCPYGFLYGNRHYLVAYSLNPKHRGFRLFALANIQKVDVLDESFRRRSDFSLSAYAERSFGVFQEKPFDVVWRFSERAARDAKEFHFHPSQKREPQEDGSLVVRFHAGGALEMAHHLAIWDDEVEVLEPTDFWDRVDEQREEFWWRPELDE